MRFSNVPAGPLPGSVIHFSVARNPNSPVKIIPTKVCSAPDGEGVYTYTLTAADTNVEPGKYFWDTRVVDDGVETLLGSGLFVVTGIAELPSSPEP